MKIDALSIRLTLHALSRITSGERLFLETLESFENDQSLVAFVLNTLPVEIGRINDDQARESAIRAFLENKTP